MGSVQGLRALDSARRIVRGGPDETYRDEMAALARLITLLSLNQHTAPQTPITLSELRERRNCTQVSIATKLKIRQSLLSAMERREDVQIGTIRDFVTALNGKLEMLAIFDDVCYVIDTKRNKRSSKALALPIARMWISLSMEEISDSTREVEEPKFTSTLNYSIPV